MNATVSPEAAKVVRMLAAEQGKDNGVILDQAIQAFYAMDIKRFAGNVPGGVPSAMNDAENDAY